MVENHDNSLLCVECGETCGPSKGCDLYLNDPDGTDHLHLAGGHSDYGLCEPCLEKFYQRHRPSVDGDGRWEWLKTCSQGCGFCQTERKIP